MIKSVAPFLIAFTIAYAADRPCVEIECSIQLIERDKIHPAGNRYTTDTYSENWSGYIAGTNLQGESSANGTVEYAAGCWTVPTLTPTASGTYCAIWVGIDGFADDTVEQLGTSHNWIDGKQQNYAWFEMYPGNSYQISGFPVNIGDEISVRIGYKGDNTFKMVMFNHTQGVSTVVPTSYTVSSSALRSTAEWIVEAPYSNKILPLSDFGMVTFNYCSAIIDGMNGLISGPGWVNDNISMVSTTAYKAQPSALMKDGSCFQVAWKSE